MEQEGFNPSRKHIHNKKNILITHTKWQLNDVQLKCTMVDEGMRKLRLAFTRELERTKKASWVSDSSNYSFNLQPLFSHTIYPRNLSSLFWQCFPCSLTYQIVLISLISFTRRKTLQYSKGTFWKFWKLFQVKKCYLKFGFWKVCQIKRFRSQIIMKQYLVIHLTKERIDFKDKYRKSRNC